MPRLIIVLIACLGLAGVSPNSNAADATLLTRDNYVDHVSSLLKRAKKEIRVYMYLVRYEPDFPKGPVTTLLNSLVDAKKRGVTVTVVLDKDNDFLGKGVEDTKNQAAFAYLKSHNVNVSYDSPTTTSHQKIIVVDRATVVIGSTNWTYAALKKSHEASLLIRSTALSKKLINEYKTPKP